MPGSEIPGLVLALIPILVHKILRWQRCRWHLRRSGDQTPIRKCRWVGVPGGVRVDVFPMDCGEEPPAVWIIQGQRLHYADALRVPQEIRVVEGPSVIPCIVSCIAGHRLTSD